jgi:hypothetical protein
MCFMSFLISCGGILRFLSVCIDGPWIGPLMLSCDSDKGIVLATFCFKGLDE